MLTRKTSQERQTEAQIELFQRFVETSGQALGMATLEGRIFYANATLCRLLGEENPEKIYQTDIFAYYEPRTAQRLQEEILPKVQGAGQWSGELALMDGQGRTTPTIENIFLLRDDKGQPYCIANVITDISESLRREEELRIYRERLEDLVHERTAALEKSERAFRSFFEAAPVPVALIVDRMAVKVNPAMARATGYSEEELTRQPAGMLYGDDEEFQHADGIAYAQMESKGMSAIETRLKHKDGSIMDVLLYSCPLNPQDLSAGVIVIGVDITEKKGLEEQLFQVQKMESIGRLAGGVAHDFNNLLTAISGNTELALMEKDLGPKVNARLKVIQQAATSAAKLTKQLLAFSRKQIIELKVIDLNELIRDMGKMLSRVVGEAIILRSNNQPGLRHVKVDPGQIQQIIMNLAVNARDAMSEGGILNIETSDILLDEAYCHRHGYGTPGAHVMVAVSDTGSGMTDEVKLHLFEPFFTTKPMGKGTGLGLATVYGAVKQNNGFIDVHSEPGMGTCFKIYFPAVSDDRAPTPEDTDADDLPGGGETVLLVEDDPGVLEFARSVLELLGYHVLAASSGEEAVSLAQGYDDLIQLLMTDVKLPGMNGRQVAEQLTRQRPGIKVLYNSGYTHDTIAHQGVLEEDLNFIGKPFSATALARKLRAVLDGK